MIECDFSCVDTFYVEHYVLNKLVVDGCLEEGGCRVVIKALKLEAFLYEGKYVASFVFKDTRSLHSVCIVFGLTSEEIDECEFRREARWLARLVKACSSTMRLFLSGNSLTALYRSSLPLPMFQNLTCLALGHMGINGWRTLAQFLKRAPNLTRLTFEEELEFIEDYASFESSLLGLPTCLALRLQKIEIWECNWLPNEIKFIELFLKNGRVLHELIIHCLPCENIADLEKLTMLPRHSEACQVHLKDKNILGKSRYSRENWF